VDVTDVTFAQSVVLAVDQPGLGAGGCAASHWPWLNGVEEFRSKGREVAGGIRQPLTEYVESHSDLRLIDEAFMQIQQAVGTTKTRSRDTQDFLSVVIEERDPTGFVADALRRAGHSTTLVARPRE
jgi:polar amino acid transport system substrate-binding protein